MQMKRRKKTYWWWKMGKKMTTRAENAKSAILRVNGKRKKKCKFRLKVNET